MKKILCIDFDGVIHSYKSGWKGAHVIPDVPVDGAINFLIDTVRKDKYSIAIYSARSCQKDGIAAMKNWLFMWGVPTVLLEKISFPREKPPAFLTIDDRAICFDGDFSSLTDKIKTFKAWWDK